VSAAIDRVAEGGSRRAGGRQSGALAMLDPVGFWSYARQDDAHSDGQLSQLRAIVGKQIGLQFGAEVTLWQDIAAIPYGADWAEAIERTIGQTTFFIPIVTPRFLKSRYCREEFLSFRRRMQALGRGDLIFPVHYVDVADIRPEETLFGDDLAALKRSQWIDFRPLFYADPKSQEVRRWAGELAGDVLKALRRPVAAAPERAALHEAPRATEAERIEETPPVAPEIAPPPKPLRPAPQPPAPVAGAAAPEEPAASPAPAAEVRAIPREAAPATPSVELPVLRPAPLSPAAERRAPSAAPPAREEPAASQASAPEAAPARANGELPLISSAPRGPQRWSGVIVAVVTLVGVVAAILGVIAIRAPSGLATAPTQTPTAVASPANSGACDGSRAPLAPLSSRAPGVLSAAEQCGLKPKDVFRECADCPAMVVLPAGSFTMGSPASEPGLSDFEVPQHEVTIAKPFAVGEFTVTVDEFKAFVAATRYDAGSACYAWNGGSLELLSNRSWRAPGFEQTGSHPVICVNSNDAQAYAKWLSGKTGEPYRPLTEAEWEYAARAGATTTYYWGDEIGKGNANCDGCGSQWDNKGTSPVGSFKPNAFGLYDMAGNVWQWVQDCFHGDYSGAPSDGSAWTTGDCSGRVVRGGSWSNDPRGLRAANRYTFTSDHRINDLGFRVGRTLAP